MRYIIFGAGAIGGTIGARLFQHGYDVLLIARGAHLQAVEKHGLIFKSPAETVALAIDCVGHPSDIEFRPDDIVLITTKTQHSAEAFKALRDAAGENTPVACGQNGVANERMALRLFRRVYGMTVFVPASHLQPGIVQTEAKTTTGILDIGRYPSGVDETIRETAQALSASNFFCRAVPDVMRWKYAKLLGNLGNALGGLCEKRAEAEGIAKMMSREALECYEAAGIEWAGKDEVAERRGSSLELGTVDGKPRPGSSSWQSIARGTGSIESDYLNGEIVLLGRLHGIPTPANQVLQQLANRMAREGLRPGCFSAGQLEQLITEASGS